MDASAAKPNRTLVVILSVIASLVIVSLVVVFSRGEPESLDPSTPEGVVQRYAVAVIGGDEIAAAAYLTEGALSRCEKDFAGGTPGDIRITLLSTEERASSADVRVSIVTTYEGGLFGPSESTTEDVFDLVTVDGEWRIDNAPWDLTICSNVKVGP